MPLELRIPKLKCRSFFVGVSWGLAACLVHPLAAWAARPMITDDARIVDAQSCQLETWVRRTPQGDEPWALPGCNPSGNIEFTLGGARFAGGPPDGLGLFQAKTLFQSLEASRLAWGLALGVTRTRPAGASEAYGYIPLTLAVVPDRAFAHLNLGARQDVAGRTTQRTWGLGLETVITARAGVIAEAFSQERGRTQYQGGLRVWLIPDRVQVDTTVGNRAGQAPGQGTDRWFSVGLRLLSPPFLP